MYILISGPTCKMEMTIMASFFLAQYLADATHGNYFCYYPPGELSDYGWSFLYCWTAIYIFACMLTRMSTFFSGGGLVAKSCPILATPWTVACQAPLPESHGIFQARILKWVAISFFRESSQSRNQTQVSCIAGGFFTDWATREAPLSFLLVANSFYRDMVLYGQPRDVFWAPIWA